MPDIKNKLLQKQLDGTIVTVQDSLPFKVPYNLLEDSKTSDNPSTVPIEVIPSNGYDGIRKVIVPAIHDGNLRPENIIQGVTILGVEGTATTDNLQHNKTINPPLHTTTFDPNTGFRGMEHVTVNGILESEPSLVPENIKKNVSIYGVVGVYDGNPPPYDGTTDMYVGDETGIQVGDLSVYDEDLIPSNIRNGVTIFGVTGNYGGGSSILGTKTVNPSTTTSTYNASEDSLDGYSSFTVNAINTQTKDATPSTSSQEITPDSGKYLTAVNISAIQTETKTESASATQDVEVNRSTGKFMTKVTINKVRATESGVTKDITSDMIKDGVTILGVEGNYSGEGSSVGPKPTEVIPMTIPYTYYASSDNLDGYSQFTVKKVTAIVNGVETDISSDMIRTGVTILGVEGTYSGEPVSVVDIFKDGTWKYEYNNAISLGSSDSSIRVDSTENAIRYFITTSGYNTFYMDPKITIPSGYNFVRVHVKKAQRYYDGRYTDLTKFGYAGFYTTIVHPTSDTEPSSNYEYMSSVNEYFTLQIPSDVINSGSMYLNFFGFRGVSEHPLVVYIDYIGFTNTIE